MFDYQSEYRRQKAEFKAKRRQFWAEIALGLLFGVLLGFILLS